MMPNALCSLPFFQIQPGNFANLIKVEAPKKEVHTRKLPELDNYYL